MARPKKTAASKWRRTQRFRLRKRVYRNRHGYAKLQRRLPEMAYSNGAISGTGNVTDPTGSCLNATILGQTVGTAAGNNLWDVGFSLNFRLDQLINHTDITGISDKYRIKGAYVKIYYNQTSASTTNNTVAGMPMVQYIIDKDDKIVPSVNGLREKMGAKFKTFKNGSSYIGIKCVPTPTAEVFATGVNTGYEIMKRSPWIDCAYPNVEHYGIKGVLSGVPLPGSGTACSLFRFDVSLIIEMADFQ